MPRVSRASKKPGAHPTLRLDRLALSAPVWTYEGHGSPASGAPTGAPDRSRKAAVLVRLMRVIWYRVSIYVDHVKWRKHATEGKDIPVVKCRIV